MPMVRLDATAEINPHAISISYTMRGDRASGDICCLSLPAEKVDTEPLVPLVDAGELAID